MPDFSPLLLALVLLIALLAGVAVYALIKTMKARRQTKNIARVNAAILDYFKKSGVAVDAKCIRLGKSKSFTAFIESEPMKQFRLSHIIEMMLRQHVAKACGLQLEKIYWRFPIKDPSADKQGRNTDSIIDKKADEEADDYINEGLVNYRHLPKAEVSEIPWESFEQAAVDITHQPKES